MKGFFQYLAPFAPDYSGAVSVLFDMDGLVVLCDPGGCSGNVCGYDEPRFYGSRSQLYSAAIRDMDTIMGRDDKLEQKILKAAENSPCRFIALVGSPVTSVIGTDLKAVARGISRKTGLPVVPVDTNGLDVYDKGEQKSWMSFFRTFAPAAAERAPAGRIGILGATPLNMPGSLIPSDLEELLPDSVVADREVFFFGGPASMKEAGRIQTFDELLVLSPNALMAARFLRDNFGVPFRPYFPGNPVFDTVVSECSARYEGGRCLVLHQQVVGNALREELRQKGRFEQIRVASWFLLDEEFREKDDVFLAGEDEFQQLVRDGAFDVIIADPMMKRALGDWDGQFIDFAHFAVSGDLHTTNRYRAGSSRG